MRKNTVYALGVYVLIVCLVMLTSYYIYVHKQNFVVSATVLCEELENCAGEYTQISVFSNKVIEQCVNDIPNSCSNAECADILICE